MKRKDKGKGRWQHFYLTGSGWIFWRLTPLQAIKLLQLSLSSLEDDERKSPKIFPKGFQLKIKFLMAEI